MKVEVEVEVEVEVVEARPRRINFADEKGQGEAGKVGLVF